MKPTLNNATKCLAGVLLGLALSSALAAGFASASDAFDRGQYGLAFAQFTALAERGNAGAEHRLGVMYAMGLGVARDYGRAAAWLRKSADHGYASAENDLGVLYDQGRGVPEDPAKAARWFLKAAVQGHAGAQLNLARLYGEGRGIPRDAKQAFAWANAASELGEVRAENVVDFAGKSLTPAQLARAGKLAALYRQEYVLPFRPN